MSLCVAFLDEGFLCLLFFILLEKKDILLKYRELLIDFHYINVSKICL